MIGYVLVTIILSLAIQAAGVNRLSTLEVAGVTILTTPPPPRKWMTLSGTQPEVVAKGGYSGFFPDSSFDAYDLALGSGINGTILYCNVHFSKEGEGFCSPDINLANATFIEEMDPNGQKTYQIYGHEVSGWFGLDYPIEFIYRNVSLHQNIFTRPNAFDAGQIVGPVTIKIDRLDAPARFWLNFECAMFYNQHKISPEEYFLHRVVPDKAPEFVSSPEIGFLKAIGPKLGGVNVKLMFVFLEETRIEPTTNKPYGSLVKNLRMIKSFASGIVVPREYIWPMNQDRFLLPSTTLVPDAHKVGLIVYASGFANDNFLSYNYSFDPVREYVKFVANDEFAVDGLLSSFPSTAAEAVSCINPDPKAKRQVKTLIISHDGASGDFPGATDLAYQKAIDDGADIIDCSVQMSKDGIAFCLSGPDLMKPTTATAYYMDLSTNIPEIQPGDGIFSFDLTWSEILVLQPQMESFFDDPGLIRNPTNKNAGKFVTLSEFLQIAKTKAARGILINIQHARFLATRGLDIVGKVEAELKKAKFEKQRILIESEDSAVLLKFKKKSNYERVFYIDKAIGGAPLEVAREIKKCADAVFVHRDSFTVPSNNFAANFTNTIDSMHAANLSVYIGYLKNEFGNLLFDYFSDPYVELATLYLQGADGVVTDYPATANLYARSYCMIVGYPYIISGITPGFLHANEPTQGPPLLSIRDVVRPPLPPVAGTSPSASPTPTPPPPKKSSTTSISITTTGRLWAVVVMLVVVMLT